MRAPRKHGMYGTPTHNTWRSMVDRCTRGLDKHYLDIDIDPRWIIFEEFFSDMGIRPDDMTLDRRDCTKGYSKDNCRWATLAVQQQNKRPSKRNTNGFPGVFKSHKKFMARIQVEGKKVYLGTYNTAEEAHAVYDAKGLELFGEEWVSYTEDKNDETA